MKVSLSALLVLALAACHKDSLPGGPAAGPGFLAFNTTRNGQFDIYLMNPNGTGVAQLDPSQADDVWPAWSPDGGKIAFYSSRGTALGDSVVTYNIYVRNADGSGGATSLAATTANEIQPVWSPDGMKIAFATDRDSGDYEIYVMDANGTNLQRLTAITGEDGQPAWSPDGARIAFATTRDAPADSIPEIYVMSATDGSGPTNLTNTPTASDIHPAWSPDGTRLAFTSNRGGQYEIWVMKANGDSAMQLTHGSAPAEFPSWSPDGTRLAYDSDGHIWIMYADGSQPTRITNKLYADVIPRWKP